MRGLLLALLILSSCAMWFAFRTSVRPQVQGILMMPLLLAILFVCVLLLLRRTASLVRIVAAVLAALTLGFMSEAAARLSNHSRAKHVLAEAIDKIGNRGSSAFVSIRSTESTASLADEFRGKWAVETEDELGMCHDFVVRFESGSRRLFYVCWEGSRWEVTIREPLPE